MITNDSASRLVVPIVSVLPVAPACLTRFLASAIFWASTGELS